jgi:outer membrane protein assembly factor BamA
VKQNKSITVGVISNGNDSVERDTGISIRTEDSSLADGRVRLGLGVEALHTEWNSLTRTALQQQGNEAALYRARRGIAPSITFEVARPLTVSFGMSFEQMEGWNVQQSGGTPLRSANALTSEIHYGVADEASRLDARYNLRAGTQTLGSDFSYARHQISVRYQRKWGRQTATDEFAAGVISGRAPLFEQFVLGSNSTLRGWDRYQIDPTGGNRVVHNSVSWGYQTGEGTVETFYDNGVLWNNGHTSPLRHSLGAGYRQGIFGFYVAFPITDGRVSPVFIAGMNY